MKKKYLKGEIKGDFFCTFKIVSFISLGSITLLRLAQRIVTKNNILTMQLHILVCINGGIDEKAVLDLKKLFHNLTIIKYSTCGSVNKTSILRRVPMAQYLPCSTKYYHTNWAVLAST